MSDDSSDSEGDAHQGRGVGDTGQGIVRTSIDPNPETAEYDLMEIVAGIEGVEIEELPSFYTQVDHFVELLFRNPPAPEAQIEFDFSYAGYRIRLTQSGDVTLFDIKNSLDDV